MPCYQSTNLPSGVTTTGRTSYRTEAECNEACREGACCEGTSCTVKPQCQCQCTTGNCCGPDTVTIRNGAETWPVYRVETKQACLARGGTWKCGTFGPQSIEGYAGTPLCGSEPGTSEPVFKGVGTTCTTGICTLLCSPGCAAPGSVKLTITVGAAFRNDFIYGYDVRDPTDSRIPDWGRAAIQAAPQTFSGEYVLRFLGQTTRSGQPLSAVYKYTTPTSDITFLWTCVSPFSPSGYPYSGYQELFAGVPPTTGLLLVNMSRSMSGCVAGLGSPEFGMAGPLISEVCQGQALQSANWPPASSMLNQSVNIRFTETRTDDITHVVGGLSGVSFSYGVQVTQA
jgi:hypothetical protein